MVLLKSDTIFLGRSYSHLDTLNSKIHPLFQINFDTEQGLCNNSRGEGAEVAGAAGTEAAGRVHFY